MTYIRKFLLALLILGFLCSCTQTPEQRAKDATVLMVIGNADGTVSNGSGFFVESDKIATNIHVVDSAKIVFAVGTKKVYNIEGVTGYAPEHDLVVLKVSSKGRPLELSEGQMGEQVSVLGYPGGGYDEKYGMVHRIRESDKALILTAKGFPENRSDSPLDGGNSGGPILNSKWEVIGIAVSSYESFSYASASSGLKALLNLVEEENFSDWQKRVPIRAFVYKSYGDKKLRGGDYKLAIEGLDEAIKLYQYAEAYNDRGDTKRSLGQHQEAIQDYTEAIRLIPDDAFAYYKRGIAKSKDGDHVEAIEDFDKALKLNPDYADAYLKRGVAKVRMSEPDCVGAIQDYTEGINRHPEDPWNYYSNRGSAKIEKSVPDYAGAIEDYTKAIRLKDDFVVAYLDRGLAKEKKAVPDYAGAIEDYKEVINLNPDNVTLVRVYRRLGDAKKALKQDVDAKRDYAKAYYYWGKALSNSNNYQEAIKHFDKSIELNPDYTAYYARGNAEQKIDHYERAIQDYTQAINRNRDYAEAYFARSSVQLFLGDNGDYQAAVADLEAAIKSNPNYAEAYHNLGATQYHLGEYKVAIDHFDKAIELKGTYANAYEARGVAKKALEAADAKSDFAMADYLRGNEAYEGGRYLEAIKNFDKILVELALDFDLAYDARGNAKTEHSKSKVALGDLENALKLYQAAIEDRDKAIELDPARALSYNNRGSTKFLRAVIRDYNGMIEDYQSAIQDFTEAIKRKSDLVNTYNLRGMARCLLGYAKANYGQPKEARKQYDLALEDFKKAIKLDSDNAKHYRGLGLANAALGKAKAAIDAFEKAKQLEPESEK